MKATRAVVVSLLLAKATSFAAEADLESVKAQLKPLRERAYREPEVVDARAKLDSAYAAYWNVVRAAMLRLDPASKDLIERDVTHRKSLEPIRPTGVATPPPKAKPSAEKSSPPAAVPPDKNPKKSPD